ncbi:MAG TPA: hypothetical protein DCX89_06475 [Saprospirales bacterium]|nr:hypothetical protein [Saprospirales bacterium]HAY71517.1 hypothetical protein [Saprospirales bacterium]
MCPGYSAHEIGQTYSAINNFTKLPIKSGNNAIKEILNRIFGLTKRRWGLNKEILSAQVILSSKSQSK